MFCFLFHHFQLHPPPPPGAEGTLGVITELTLRVATPPPAVVGARVMFINVEVGQVLL
mgnify:CR=1 FL=1